MSNKRVTFKVRTMLDHANHILSSSKDSDVGVREGVIIMIEEVLHRTNNYNGFCYLNRTHLTGSNQVPGININEDGSFIEDYNLRFVNTDSTRRQYF